MREFDAIVVGAGQGGVPLAKEFAAAGKQTALIERQFVGGSCINYGCTPSKTLYHSARVAHLARRGRDFGLLLEGVEADLAEVCKRVQGVVNQFRASTTRGLMETEGLDLILGHARFTSPRTLSVQGVGELQGERIFIDVGTRAKIPNLPGLEGVEWLDNARLLELGELPSRLIVLGGGYVGLEFAQMFRRLGSEVVVVESSGTLLGGEDAEVRDAVREVLQEDGVEILLGETAERVEGAVTLHLESGLAVSGSHLLLSIGRTPNTADLGLEAAGIETDRQGHIRVDEKLQTSAEGVYALGDATGGPAFTHISYDDYRILRDNLLNGGDRSTSDRSVPYVMYLDPQLGRIGPSEGQLRDSGASFETVRIEASEISRVTQMGETRGFVKAAIHPSSGKLLSATCFCAEGGEVLSMLQVAMFADLDCRRLSEAIFAHPTLAEGLNTLFA
jgi:pyruvate/2-oxoglutarate dehydrogenase complex dihydrolipoamide dehydrogenase (E3) component